MLNTLGVRSAVGEANRRKLSFRNVSNVVVQLLHTIKPYSVPAPFSHLANTGSGFSNESAGGFQDNKTRQVSVKATDASLVLINYFLRNYLEYGNQEKIFTTFLLFIF